jgi:putative PIN family toxin of toxin-antitoxin system
MPFTKDSCQTVVLDTNIVLDVFVFNDSATLPLRNGLLSGSLQWLATEPMRDELERVLTYPKLIKQMVIQQLDATAVLDRFDRLARLLPVVLKAPVTCKDPDDQKFIDLAFAHRTWLLSRDRAILSLSKRLLSLSVTAQATISQPGCQ